MLTCINVVSSYCNKRVASVESMIEAPNPLGLTKLRHFWFDPKQPVFLWWMCPLLYTVVVRGAGWSCSFCVGVCVYVCVLCKANLLVVCRNKHVYPPVLFHLLLSLHISSPAPLYRLCGSSTDLGWDAKIAHVLCCITVTTTRSACASHLKTTLGTPNPFSEAWAVIVLSVRQEQQQKQQQHKLVRRHQS